MADTDIVEIDVQIVGVVNIRVRCMIMHDIAY